MLLAPDIKLDRTHKICNCGQVHTVRSLHFKQECTCGRVIELSKEYKQHLYKQKMGM